MKKLLPLFLLATLPTTLPAATAFIYNNQPISPVCFSQMLTLDKNKTSVSLASCASGQQNSAQNHSRYAVIGNDGNKFFIVTHQNTGGSGDFSNVIWVEKTNDSLKLLKVLSSGDRCNNGVEAAGVWQYRVNLTPVSLVNMGSGAPLKLDAYRDLDDGATSCVAKALYQFNPKSQTAKLKEVKFNSKQLTMEQWVTDINYQYCFTRLYNSYLDRGQISLNQTDLDRFKNQFEGICMQSGR